MGYLDAKMLHTVYPQLKDSPPVSAGSMSLPHMSHTSVCGDDSLCAIADPFDGGAPYLALRPCGGGSWPACNPVPAEYLHRRAAGLGTRVGADMVSWGRRVSLRAQGWSEWVQGWSHSALARFTSELGSIG